MTENKGIDEKNDIIFVQSAAYSNYQGYDVLYTFDRYGIGTVPDKVFLGKRENYDNNGRYDNSDNSLIYISDNLKMGSFLDSGEGWTVSQQEMIDNGTFTKEDYEEFSHLKETILKSLDEIRPKRFEIDVNIPGSGVLFQQKNTSVNESDIILHIKYEKTKDFNGCHIKYDSINFNSMEELQKFINGQVAFNTLDDTVKKRNDEILLYAEKDGNIVWKNEKSIKEVEDHVTEYLKKELPSYQLLDVRPKSNHPDDSYLYMVTAKKNDGTYAVWTSWNELIKSLNYGHYDLPDLNTCEEILKENFNDAFILETDLKEIPKKHKCR